MPAHLMFKLPTACTADGSVSGTLKQYKSAQPELGPDVQVRPLRQTHGRSHASCMGGWLHGRMGRRC